MFSHYCVVKHDFEKNQSAVLSILKNKYEAINVLENEAAKYVQARDGESDLKIYNSYSINSKKPLLSFNGSSTLKTSKVCLFNKDDFQAQQLSLITGHYVVRNAKSNLYKLTVWRNEEMDNSGWIFKGVKYVWTKVFSIDLVYLPQDNVIDDHDQEEELSIFAARQENSVFGATLVSKLKAIEELDGETKINLSKLRYDYDNEFTACPLAKKYSPKESPEEKSEEKSEENSEEKSEESV